MTSLKFSRPPTSIRVAKCESNWSSIEAHLEAAKAESHFLGQQDGQTALSEQLLTQRRELSDLVNNTIQSMEGTIPKIIANAEDHLVRLSLALAKKLVANTPVQEEVIRARIQQILADLPSQTDVTVLLNPEDLALLQKLNNEDSETGNPRFDATRKLNFESDTQITRGGCEVRTAMGDIDATMETITESLTQSVESMCQSPEA